MKEQFINLYPLSKTLRFSLIPVGKTEENFNNKLLLEEDEKRAEEYEKVKSYIDRFHKSYIDRVLSSFILDGVEEYASLYYKSGKNDDELKQMSDAEASMRKTIANTLTSDKMYKLLFGKEMIQKLLPSFLTESDELESVEMFRNFTTYFTGFYENRKNMYSEEAQTTAISYRCINENLPKFLDNAASFKKVIAALPADTIEELNENFLDIYGIRVIDIFNIDYFSFVLSQSGIDRYNGILGGYTCSDKTKIQGLNECINLYNQQVAGNDKSKRLPLMKQLYKQILSDRESVSFIPESFKDDNELLCAVNELYNILNDEKYGKTLVKTEELFNSLSSYNDNGIFVTNGVAVTDISNAVFGNWSVISTTWNEQYEAEHPLKSIKNAEKYYDDEKKAYKKIGSFSVAELQKLGNNAAENSIINYYAQTVSEKITAIHNSYNLAKELLTNEYNQDKKLCRNDDAIELIRKFLDNVKELERLVKPLLGTGKEENKDENFYGDFIPLYESLCSVDRLYDKVRNYLTQKPYSKDKIKLNFENPQLLGGWDKNKERDYRTVLLRKGEKYYLGIMDKTNSKAFVNPPEDDGTECFEKVEYKLLPGPNKMLPKVFFASSNIDTFAPSNEILEIRAKETFKKGAAFSIEDCHKFIDFFKCSIEKHPDWSQFGFKFSPTESYKDISEFYNEVKEQGYTIKFKNIPVSYIDSLVESGQLYLFQIYNKDFSEYSKGTPNLHTLYFKEVFDENNLKNVVYQLNGGAEMFYRKASINDREKIVHPANKPIDNKNPDNQKKQSTFAYDITKDSRFTKRQFALHVPITLNFKAQGINVINEKVRKAIKINDDQYVIGIDRGERNLIYVCVINGNGEIVEQMSLNEIISDNGYKVNYHDLLDRKEKERDDARKSWGTVEGIKELKEGYMSQVIHKICDLVVKYDAVIAMEDLNSGFKNSRTKVEKQVYQKFEKMLTDKLNFLVDKKLPASEKGGLLNAYQLTNKPDGKHKGMQDGIIFYIPAWLTSKIDPTTGFADLLKPKYKSVSESKTLFGTFDDIKFNKLENMFEFDIDYSKLPRCNADFKQKWTVCTNADRIKTFRNPEKNNEWDNQRVILTDEFKSLFEANKIDYSVDLKEQILSQASADFYKELTRLFALTLQMRNSVTGSTRPEDDYLISPVRNSNGEFYDSRNYSGSCAVLPADADANGAYNIARKVLWAAHVIKNTDDSELLKAKLSITNKDWLEFAQK